VHLLEKPASNVLNFTVDTKGLDFFYQPALTPEEIVAGANRPENVVGSYAVYYKNCPANYVGGKEYKAGKAFHIYRPWAEDSAGTHVWCDLNITDGLMTVTLPQTFVDTAVYPVVVDPTFGYTTKGASEANLITSEVNDTPAGLLGTLSENAIAFASMSFYARHTLAAKTLYGIVYSGSAGALGSSLYTTVASDTTVTSHILYTRNFASPPANVSSTTYWLEAVSAQEGAGNGNAFISYDTGGAANTGYAKSGGTPAYNTNRYSIYVTYISGVPAPWFTA
jgi:hypothetical protein